MRPMTVLFALVIMFPTLAVGQDVDQGTVLVEVYDFLREKLPSGQHAILLDDAFRRPRRDARQAEAVHRDASQLAAENRLIARRRNLPVGRTTDYLLCNTTIDCRFAGDVTATVSLHLQSAEAGSAVVEATTRYFSEDRWVRERFDIAHQVLVYWEVRLQRNDGHWTVVSAEQIGHS